ncbi:MAG: insulinase family protein [Clostridia bacterium]|nr:insulinase family protein [Clostridia bacterium]
MQPHVKVFENGMRLVFKKVEKNRPATVFVSVKAGSINEDESNNGISHFIEHLNFKGTEKRTAKQISTQLEEIGANANAFTSKYATCFFATVLPEQIENCFEILSDLVFNSKYDKEDIERERQVIFEEIDMYQDDPESVCYEEFCKNFYVGSPMQRTILGTKESLANITREDILDYISKRYVAKNIVVSVVGDFTVDQVKKLTQKYFSNKFKSKSEVDEIGKGTVVIPDKKFSFIKKDVAQTHIVFGFPCDNIYSESRMAHTLCGFIFGGGMGSRLFQKIREEHGLVYSISCMPEMYALGGNFVVSLGTNKKNEKKALEFIKEQIDLLVKDGFKQEELDRAKTFCKSLLLSSGEMGSDIAKTNASNLRTYNKIISIEERLNKVDSVTLDDINEVAKKVFNYSNMCGCVVSNNPNEELFKIFD